MIVDTHAHFTPQSMLDALQKDISHFPSVELLVEDTLRDYLRRSHGNRGESDIPHIAARAAYRPSRPA